MAGIFSPEELEMLKKQTLAANALTSLGLLGGLGYGAYDAVTGEQAGLGEAGMNALLGGVPVLGMMTGAGITAAANPNARMAIQDALTIGDVVARQAQVQADTSMDAATKERIMREIDKLIEASNQRQVEAQKRFPNMSPYDARVRAHGGGSRALALGGLLGLGAAGVPTVMAMQDSQG